MIKRIIALIITVIFLVPGASLAQENNAEINTENREVITGLFSALGINSKVSEDGVTRGEFILTAAGLMNYDLNAAADSAFEDIESGTELAGAASFCLAAGLISRADEFRPEDKILENEALKILVCALGYGSSAEKSGGYPNGYVSEAVRLKLLKGVKASENGTLFQGGFYALMKNTIEANAREIDEYSKNGYSVKTDRTILEICHDVTSTEGIVNANEYAYLYDSAQKTGKRRAVIGDEEYKLADSVNIPPLGFNVEAYVLESGSDDDEIIYYHSENNSVSSFDLSDAQIGSGGKISITEKNAKSHSFNLSTDAAVIYNGKPYSGKLTEMLTDGNGKIELVKRKSDSDYGLLMVWESKFMKIGTTNTADKLIYDETTKNSIDYSNKDAVLTVEGGAVLKKGDVIEYFESQDKKLYTVSVLEKITAKAEAKNDSDITIGGTDYRMTEYFKREYLNVLRLDTELDFYLSESGIVLCSNPSDGDYLFAYITKTCAPRGLKDAEIELFTENGEYKVFRLSGRVSVDGNKLSGDALYNEIKLHENSLVRINPGAANGNLKFINTDRTPSSYDTTGDVNYWFETDTLKTGEESKLLKRLRYNSNEDESFYYKSSGYFVPYFSINDETRIFCVMKDGFYTDEDDRVSLGAGTAFLPNDESVTAGDVTAYNVDSAGYAKAIVYKTESYGAPINYESSYGVVSDMYMRRNDDGDMDLAIEVYADDAFRLLYVSEDESWYENIEKKQNGFPYSKGDVIRYSVDKKGYIKNQPILDFDAETMTVINDGAENSSLHYTYGMLYDCGDSSVTVIDSEDGKIKCYQGKITSCGYVPKKDDITTIYSDRLVSYRQAGENCSRVLLKCRSSRVEAYIVYE